MMIGLSSRELMALECVSRTAFDDTTAFKADENGLFDGVLCITVIQYDQPHK